MRPFKKLFHARRKGRRTGRASVENATQQADKQMETAGPAGAALTKGASETMTVRKPGLDASHLQEEFP